MVAMTFAVSLPVFLRIALATVAAAASTLRPCTDSDWHTSFGTCDALGHRNVYVYAAREGQGTRSSPVCNERHPESRPRPRSLMNVSCQHECLTGMYLGTDLVSSASGAARVEQSCQPCPAGKFSLGGGLLVSGVSGDWRRRWPGQLQSSCRFHNTSGWQSGGIRQPRCALRVTSPEIVAGIYEVQDASWNNEGRRLGPLSGRLVQPPGKGDGCGRYAGFDGPGAAAAQLLLVRQGGCSAEQKAIAGEAAGASAVLLIRKGANMSSSSSGPAAAPALPGQAQSVRAPLFIIDGEFGDVLASAVSRFAVMANFTSPAACGAAPPVLVNTSSNTSEQGCSPWTPDPSGQFIHSGDNRRHDSIISSLVLSAYFVRDGHVAFRYAVDAERGFDGFSLELDWTVIIEKTSFKATYEDVIVNVSQGQHTLRWQYSKDFSLTSGQDRAWVQLLEAVGTEYADLDCRACSSNRQHSNVGAATCVTCPEDTYLQRSPGAVRNLAKCVACPPGRWSPPDSVGSDSCQERLACRDRDIEVRYTPCVNKARQRHAAWKQPMICNASVADSVLLSNASAQVACEPCQLNQHRPDGGDCVPRVQQCSPGQYAPQEVRIDCWQSWPRNFTQEFVTEEPDVPVGLEERHGWRLDTAGVFAFAGDGADSTVGGQDFYGLALGEDLLHFDVQVYSSAGRGGSLKFICEVRPVEAWGREARFLLDGVPAEGLQVISLPGNRLQVSSPLSEGMHRLTWSWLRHAGVGDQATASGPARGFILRNLTVGHAVGAGSITCADCPLGYEVLEDGLRCSPCAAGKASQAGSYTCRDCPTHHYSGPAASWCRPCGFGLSSPGGSSACHPIENLRAWDAVAGGADQPEEETPVAFNVSGLADAWEAATRGVQGAFAVSSRRYQIRPFQPSAAPGGDEGVKAYIWEVESTQAPSVQCAGPAASADSPAAALGTQLESVMPVTLPDVRGVRITYSGTEQCPRTGQPRFVSLLFQCNPRAGATVAARQDRFGATFLPNLRLQPFQGVSEDCANISLDWPTPAACPQCRMTDYVSQVGTCAPDGYRDVSFTLARPCLGGAQAPETWREPCQVSSVRGTTVLLKAVLATAMLLGCSLCTYAGYLHRKYARRTSLPPI